MLPRVLHVGPLPPPFGGVAVMMQSLMQAGPLQVFDHTCFNTSRGTTWELVGYKNFNLARAVRRIKMAGQLALHVRRLRPHIIHFQCSSDGPWDFPGSMLMFLGAKASKARMVLHWHRDPATATFPGPSRATQTFFRATAGTADTLLVLSERYRQALTGSYPAKTFVVPNTFDSALLSLPWPRPMKRCVHVIFIGRLTREKGILDLLQVASEVVARIPYVRFVLAGAPIPAEGGMTRLRELIAVLGLDKNISVVGPISGDEKLQFFSQGDIMLFPSHRESFGIAGLEGMASGIPILAYSIGFLPDLIRDGVAGFLVDSGDVQALSSRLLQLIEDPGLRARMGQSGREEAKQKYTVNVVASKVRDVYTELMERA